MSSFRRLQLPTASQICVSSPVIYRSVVGTRIHGIYDHTPTHHKTSLDLTRTLQFLNASPSAAKLQKAILLDGLLTHLLVLLIVVAVEHWCYVLLLYPLALDVKTLETRRSLVFDGIDIDANGKHCRLKVADENIAFPRR